MNIAYLVSLISNNVNKETDPFTGSATDCIAELTFKFLLHMLSKEFILGCPARFST